jgi:hypothetical protein
MLERTFGGLSANISDVKLVPDLDTPCVALTLDFPWTWPNQAQVHCFMLHVSLVPIQQLSHGIVLRMK